jgi:hypothetical protein
VSSRFLVGVGAWLLGAVTATTGSMIAVDQLAHGLLGSPVQQLSGSSAADLEAGDSPLSPSPTASAGDSASAGQPVAHVTHAASASPAASAGAAAAQSPVGTLLESGDGSVMAICQPAGAYLLYWSPDQGFQADQVYRGPAAIASVTFRGSAGSILMQVSCPAGTPVARLFHPSSDGGDGGDRTGE